METNYSEINENINFLKIENDITGNKKKKSYFEYKTTEW